MYPHERSLVEKYKGKPFALLAVDTDSDPAEYKRAVAAGQITWRSWWDAGGMIARAWGIQGWPTIFLIDANGTVRYRLQSGHGAEALIDGLLQEAEKARS